MAALIGKIRQFLRCDTLEDCQRIQRGYLRLRRLRKWSVLFTIGIVLLISDGMNICVDRVTKDYEHATHHYRALTAKLEGERDQYETAREQWNKISNSTVYRWTVGWFYPPIEAPAAPSGSLPEPPELDEGAIALYRAFNAAQFAIFLWICVYSLRWVYADYRAEGKSGMFVRFCGIAILTNLILYLVLRSLVAHLLPNKAPVDDKTPVEYRGETS